MSDWKNTEWQKNLKNKPFKYWIRDEIEEIVKEEYIDRKRFGEYSKFKYENYIVSPEFEWMIAYCDDGESAALYRV